MNRPDVSALARTAVRLGPANIARIALYRGLRKAGAYERRHPVAAHQAPARFAGNGGIEPVEIAGGAAIVHAADRLVAGKLDYFGSFGVDAGSPPDWFHDPYKQADFQDRKSHWSRLSDFGAGGDIKVIWELSRFGWCLPLVQAAIVSGDSRYIETANAWIADWQEKNPVNAGPNWMCGQETSIRLLHVLLADALLRKHAGLRSPLDEFVSTHCERIAATTSYALAQANNHSISEAAALYAGGDWLARNSRESGALGRRYRLTGTRMLERQVARLILADGTFSQFSVNYHRLLLDTLSFVECWRRENELPAFSEGFRASAASATDWLLHAVEPRNGAAPNVGANDGAHLYRLSPSPYRDFRPTVQLAATIFLEQRACRDPGPWDAAFAWLGLEPSETVYEPERCSLRRQGGFTFLRHSGLDSMLLCRSPGRQFRPSHADALHVDVWCRGENVARDAGTYSYAADAHELQYYKGTASHNTIQFDDRDQMRTIGRFLFADWLESDLLEADAKDGLARWHAAYTDYEGCRHERVVEETGDGWRVTDRVSGPFRKAVLRWRLHPDWGWNSSEGGVYSTSVSIQLEASRPFTSIALEDGQESRHYLQETRLPVLTAAVAAGECEIVSTFRIADA